MYDSCLAARRSKLVGGMCSILPYGIGIFCDAFIYFSFFLLLLSIPFFILFKNQVLINQRNGPSHMCFFNRGDTEGTNS